MRKQPKENRDILVRAMIAAARELGAESPWLPKAVTWFVDNVPALVGLFGDESQMYREIKYQRTPGVSRDNHIAKVMQRYGYEPEHLDAVRKKFDRWQHKCKDIFDPDTELGEVLWHCLKHLFPPRIDPHEETETFYV
jgi:hypothetical protein